MPEAQTPPAVRRTGQNMISLGLAALILSGWFIIHVGTIFFLRPGAFFGGSGLGWILVLPVVVLQCWLSVGLFIVAHDAMHGTLVVGSRRLNRLIGQLCLALYAAFPFGPFNDRHHRHHQVPGSPEDPDYGPQAAGGFVSWYFGFMVEYFGLREFTILTIILMIYILVLGAPIINLLVFWSMPALLSSLQLFYFGTYLPHRPGKPPFVDRHNARSNRYSRLASLLTCFHFGYHLEHHRYPYLPWWRLPEAVPRTATASGG